MATQANKRADQAKIKWWLRIYFWIWTWFYLAHLLKGSSMDLQPLHRGKILWVRSPQLTLVLLLTQRQPNDSSNLVSGMELWLYDRTILQVNYWKLYTLHSVSCSAKNTSEGQVSDFYPFMQQCPVSEMMAITAKLAYRLCLLILRGQLTEKLH